MAIGIAVFLYFDLLEGLKNRLFSNVFLGIISLGPIITCLFLFTNQCFSGSNSIIVKSAITEKYHGHSRAYIDRPAESINYITFSMLGCTRSKGFSDAFKESYDSARFVIVTYKNGFLGYPFLIKYDLVKE